MTFEKDLAVVLLVMDKKPLKKKKHIVNFAFNFMLFLGLDEVPILH